MNLVHGNAPDSGATPEYNAWKSMRARCERRTVRGFERYGGRGIRVCGRWQVFENVLADMGRRPSPEHSLDRIDNDGNYEPGNCRWATKSEQQQNNSNTKLTKEQVIEIRKLRREGARLSDLSVRFGVTAQTISLIAKGRKWLNVPLEG